MLVRLGPAIATAVALGVAWESIARLTGLPVYLLPAPSAVLQRLFADTPMLAGHTLATLLEAVAGLLLGSTAAFLVGALMARSSAAERGLYPLVILVKMIPAVALAPLLIIWLGFGPAPKVVVAALICFFPFVVGTVAGLRAAEPGALEVFRTLGANERELFLRVRLPWALPQLFAALRVATTLALIGAMVSEWLGADRGLGLLVMQANANLDMAGLFAAVLVLALLGAVLNAVVGLAERRALHWHPSALEGPR